MSLTIGALFVMVLGRVLDMWGVGYLPGETEQFVNGVAQVAGVVGAWYGRYRLGGVGVLGNRK